MKTKNCYPRQKNLNRMMLRPWNFRSFLHCRNRFGRNTSVPEQALVRSKNMSSYTDPLPIPEKCTYPGFSDPLRRGGRASRNPVLYV